jgi:hypothetical protein
MSEQDNFVSAFMERYGLDETSAKYLLDRTKALAKTLSDPDRKPNDFALAKYLNERVVAIFSLATDQQNNADIAGINRSYILMVNELKKLYARNPELNKISEPICWKDYDRVEYIHDSLWDYRDSVNNDFGNSHNAQVNRLCIINNKELPNFTPELKKIVNEADKNVNAYLAELEEDEPRVNDGRFIPAYTLTYKDDGTILVNGVLRLKKTQAGQASDMIMSQAFQHDGQAEPFKPTIATKRQLTTIIGDMGFDVTLRALFFPTINKHKGIVFRSSITRDEADEQHIDTTQLDIKLKKAGAATERTPDEPINLDDIPF